MTRITTLLAASLVASAAFALPALAQGKSGDAPGHGGDGPGASASAPGHSGGGGGIGPSTSAPGHIKEGRSARDVAPGRLGASQDDDTGEKITASTGKANFGTLISSIRAGKSSLDGLADDATVTVVPADTLIRGANRVALDNALRDSEDQIDELRADLDALDLDIDQETIDAAVAARIDAEGNLVVYTE